jgi:hypothetical protein
MRYPRPAGWPFKCDRFLDALLEFREHRANGPGLDRQLREIVEKHALAIEGQELVLALVSRRWGLPTVFETLSIAVEAPSLGDVLVNGVRRAYELAESPPAIRLAGAGVPSARLGQRTSTPVPKLEASCSRPFPTIAQILGRPESPYRNK